jgi:hypothetical protein
MSSRRSPRARQTKVASVPDNVQRGLSSLVEGNENLLRSMLEIDGDGDGKVDLVMKLLEVMGVNALTVESMLARFFPQETLAAYCTSRLVGKSGNGGAPILAARIAAEWNKTSFQAINAIRLDPVCVCSSKKRDEPQSLDDDTWVTTINKTTGGKQKKQKLFAVTEGKNEA